MDNTEALVKILLENRKNDPNFSFSQALEELMSKQIKDVLGTLLNEEMESFLGYKKNTQGAAKKLGNARNGTYKRKLGTTFGSHEIDVPRDRNAEFESMLFEQHKRNMDGLVSKVLELFQTGLTESQIQKVIKELYGNHLSKSTISNMVDAVTEDVQKFQTRKLKDQYFALFVDSTYVPLRRGTVEKEAINIVIGIDLEGFPEVLAYSISPEESKVSWEDLLKDLKNRGLKKAHILVSDGFIGIDELIKTYLPDCLHQRCFIHLCRNLDGKVRKSDRALVTSAFMKVAFCATREEAEKELEGFVEEWSEKYEDIKKWYENINKNSILNFYHFPRELRRLIYTNNRCENFMKEIKRNAKAHIQFVTVETEHKFLVSRFNVYNMRVGKRKVLHSELIKQYVDSLKTPPNKACKQESGLHN